MGDCDHKALKILLRAPDSSCADTHTVVKKCQVELSQEAGQGAKKTLFHSLGSPKADLLPGASPVHLEEHFRDLLPYQQSVTASVNCA